MATLVSPGVSVTLRDESFYASAGNGTVPLVVIATAQNKFQPGSSTALASGTIKSNAGQLFLVTSQRDALQTFGVPSFYSVAGTPQYDSELNELGLFALYEYLGIANTAYVMRADVDLAALVPSTIEPTGSPTNGDYWLDLSNSTFGVFNSNGNPNSAYAWDATTPTIIDDIANLENVVQGLKYHQTPITSPTAALITADGNLVINGIAIALTAGMSLAGVRDKINADLAVGRLGIKATLYSKKMKFYPDGTKIGNRAYGDIYELRLTSSYIGTTIYLDDSNTTVMENIGFIHASDATANDTPYNVVAPKSTFGKDGDLAIDVISTNDEGEKTNQLWQKISLVTSTSTTGWWVKVGSTDADHDKTATGWTEATPRVITGTTSNPTFTAGSNVTISTGGVNFEVGLPGNVQVPDSVSLDAFISRLNMSFDDNEVNIVATKSTRGSHHYLQITNYDGTDTWLHDGYSTTVYDTNVNVNVTTTTTSFTFSAAGISTAQSYFGSVTGTADATGNVFMTGDSVSINIGGSDVVVGLTAETLDSFIADVNGNAAFASFVLNGTPVASKVTVGSANYLKITNPNGTSFKLKDVKGTAFNTAGIDAGYYYGKKLVYKGYGAALTVPNSASDLAADNIWINTTPQNRGASFVVKQYENGVWTKLNTSPNTATIPMYRDEASANTAFGAYRDIGTIYVEYNSEGANPVAADQKLKVWDGSAWTPLSYTPSYTAPKGPPAAGTYWYNTDFMVDIMVSTGQIWQGYVNAYPGTDPNGPILDASAPLTQSDKTPLVDYDLWINTSNTTDYPMIYRYNQSTRSWILIDNTDHSSASGIIFTDARATANGLKDGATTSAAMAVSDYVDSDAPNAELYPDGLLLFNTRYSTNNVKVWVPNALPTADYPDRWVTASGNKPNGTPYMGHWAQRNIVVKALKATLNSSQDVRAEQTFFNLMACPGYTETIPEMVTLNTDKKEIAFIIGDTPARLTPDGTSIQAWASDRNNAPFDGPDGLITHNRYVGLYYPWALSSNLDGSTVFVPPSVMALRTYAYNDQVAYPWFAPAGYNRGVVTGVSSVGYLTADSTYQQVQLSQGQRDVLYTNSINPIAYIPNRGLIVYGQKTLSPISSAMDRVNVARLINYLNYELDNLAKPYLFEPNDTQTRQAVTATFSGFMGNLVGLRAVYDFAVVCDDTNNTAARIDRNELWIDIAIRPEKAIEFIYIPIRLLNSSDPLPGANRS